MLRGLLLAVILVGASTQASCDLFSPRSPEPPIGEGGQFIQPDAPDVVVENLKAAIAEMNAANYRRSLDQDLVFEPTAVAEARDLSLWANWSHTEENGYFTAMAEAAGDASGNLLRLDESATDLGDARYTLDANYLLVVHHRRPGAPDTVQGRLIWEITQDADGLWALKRWTDQELGASPSWSDLKAEFGK